jgi:phospholipase C
LTDAYRAAGKPDAQCWRIYHDGMAQAMAFSALWDGDALDNWHTMDRFYEHVKNGNLPAYTFIEPCHGGSKSNSQHPGNNEHATGSTPETATDFQRSEILVRAIYDALAANRPLFDKTMLVITYDEHGGLFDHVAPPRAAAPGPIKGGNRTASRRSRSVRFIRWFVETQNTAFNFRCLGVRVPAVVVSPWIAAGPPDATQYDHTSIIATVRKLFAPGSDPLTARDRAANDLLHLVTAAPAVRATLPSLPPPWEPPVTPPAGTSVPPAAAGPVVTVRDPLAVQLPALAEHVDRRLTARETDGRAEPAVAGTDVRAAVDAPGAPVAMRFASLAHQRRMQQRPTADPTP